MRDTDGIAVVDGHNDLPWAMRKVNYDFDALDISTSQPQLHTEATSPAASLMGAEGGHSIDNSRGVLRNFYRLGVRYLTLAHNENTDWAASATDQPAHGGLTAFGREVVREMNPATATRADVVAHCGHVLEVAGVDHVGLGGDYDGVSSLPEGLDDVSCYPALFEALAEHGWSRDDLEKIAHRKISRTLRAAEQVAAELRGSRGPSLATIDQLDGVEGPS